MSQRMSRAEFIAMIAMMFAVIAFSIDSMLPALPEIGRELSPNALNNAQLILTSFVLGIGIGTFFTGPLSDAFGRKSVIVAGSALYVVGAAVAYFSTSLEVVLAARVVQGLGAAAPRIVSLAIVRDLYSGRDMARIVSIAMMIFTIFPAVAPLIGAGIIAVAGWRSIFLAFILFAIVYVSWMWVRLPESLAVENRRPFKAHLLIAAVKEMFAHPAVRMSILVQCLCLAILFSMLSMVHPIYEVVFDREESFPYWFGAVAAVSATGSLVNAALVVRVGMRRMVTWSLGLQIILAGAMIPIGISGMDLNLLFGLFLVWQAYVFFMAGTTMGNVNAIAMEPMGHIAGMAASTISGIATVAAAAIAAPIGLTFNGSLFPLTLGIFCLSGLGFLLMLNMGRIERRLTV